MANGRKEALDYHAQGRPGKIEVVPTKARTLVDAMRGADVFVGLSAKGVVSKDMVASMAPNPVIFALANPDPVIRAAGFVRSLGIRPRVAMVCFSNFDSVDHMESRRVAEAVRLMHSEDPDLEIDGEMQADDAVDAARLKAFPFSHLKSPANVLVFSSLSAAISAYKLLPQLGGADAIGPVLLGMNRPVRRGGRGSGAASGHAAPRLLPRALPAL